jgi:DNA-binding response OmpR family regulator/anti-sigma regulatory factor (Ser/Thr protein kinase)
LGLVAGNIAGEIPSKAQDLIMIAYKNSERLVRLINNILDIEKIESGHIVFERKPIQVSALLLQAKEDAEALANGSEIAIALNSQCGDAVVMGDMDRFLQVLMNLLSNAIKFSPPDGVITIDAQRRDDGMIEIGVRDQGEGIPDEFRKRIFGKFAQSELTRAKQKGGSGLGLSISRAIMQSMDGMLDYESEKGNTYFYLSIPEIGSSRNTQNEKTVPCVLIGEENKEIGAFLEMTMTKAGYECHVASSLEEIRKQLAETEYAALTLDIGISNGEGFNLIRDLRKDPNTASLPVIVITAMSNGNGVDLAAAGIVDWLDKPIDANRLLQALHSLLPYTARPRLLHVEDDGDITLLLSSAMNHVDVVSAPTLAMARKYLSEQRFDLAVLDIYMPDGNGLDLLPELTARHIPVVVLSVDETSQDIQRYVCASLVKTVVSETKVIETIKTYIGKRA